VMATTTVSPRLHTAVLAAMRRHRRCAGWRRHPQRRMRIVEYSFSRRRWWSWREPNRMNAGTLPQHDLGQRIWSSDIAMDPGPSGDDHGAGHYTYRCTLHAERGQRGSHGLPVGRRPRCPGGPGRRLDGPHEVPSAAAPPWVLLRLLAQSRAWSARDH
jgi:hypothetical protein